VSEQLRDASAGPVHPLVLLSGWPTTTGAGPIGGEQAGRSP
jgi:hypothetical protein